MTQVLKDWPGAGTASDDAAQRPVELGPGGGGSWRSDVSAARIDRADTPGLRSTVSHKWIHEVMRDPQTYVGRRYRLPVDAIFATYATIKDENEYPGLGVVGNRSFRFRLALNPHGLFYDNCFADARTAQKLLEPQLPKSCEATLE